MKGFPPIGSIPVFAVSLPAIPLQNKSRWMTTSGRKVRSKPETEMER
ncbi:hypothetical protein HMPREF1146_2008 [Prevotella sp. MSX73]|nr:hypothetical protein HMPREF1146_2008 [Prevotella sp. MSX73]